MASLNVNMPKDLREFLDKRTENGGFGTPTEYVRDLIRRDREEQREREIDELLVAGLKSGNAKGDAKGMFDRLRARVDELEASRQRNGKATRSKARR
jgi:antitoxin ParD1/3/4